MIQATLLSSSTRAKSGCWPLTCRRCNWGASLPRGICRGPSACVCRRADKVGNRIFVDGNSAAALGCVMAAPPWRQWYPIRLVVGGRGVSKYCSQKYRVDPDTGQHRPLWCRLRTRSPPSAWWWARAGTARAFTATSGPGVSLMTEFIGGLLCRDSRHHHQCCSFGVALPQVCPRAPNRLIFCLVPTPHGDAARLLLPQDPRCFEPLHVRWGPTFANPCVCRDRLGHWHEPAPVQTRPAWDDSRAYDRGKVMTAQELAAGRDFGRYKDADGDGIPWRTLPGTHPRWAATSRGTTQRLRSVFRAQTRTTSGVERLLKNLPPLPPWCRSPVLQRLHKDTAGRDLLRLHQPRHGRALDVLAAQGLALDALRLRAFPFPQSVHEFIDARTCVCRGAKP